MVHLRKSDFLFSLFLFLTGFAYAQLPVFNMPPNKDTTVNVCKGEFHDSELGQPSGSLNYGTNERDTFRICTGTPITVTFSSFCLETGLGGVPVNDTLFIYNGLAMNGGTLIGAYAGNNSPGTITAPSGCITFRFVSDASINCSGWVAKWTSATVPPVPPTFVVMSGSNCNATTLNLKFNTSIPCDSFYPSAFKINGFINPAVVSATGLGCPGVGGTNTVDISLSQPLSQNCDYIVKYTYRVRDNCDSIWTFLLTDTFLIDKCPVNLSITPNPAAVCINSCIAIKANLLQPGCLSYIYSWSHGLPPTAGPHSVCPTSTTIYSVSVQSTFGGPVYTATVKVTVSNPIINPFPFGNPMCQSVPSFTLTSTPPGSSGAYWSGPGIVDIYKGTFNPKIAGVGQFTVSFWSGSCWTSTNVTILPGSAGPDTASCPGASPINLTGFLPGGTWSGNHVTPGGIFTPTVVGTFTLIYTSPNGCKDTAFASVGNLIVNSSTDTICESINTYTLIASPPGGRWDSVPGMVDPKKGHILTSETAMGTGFHKFIYRINGCVDTAKLFIKPINAGTKYTSSCPYAVAYTLSVTPTGGIWTSISSGTITGLQNSSGLFDPGINNTNSFKDTLMYSLNGCSDTIIMSVLPTTIGADTISLCINDDYSSILHSNYPTFRSPAYGTWSGQGVELLYLPWYNFITDSAGVGAHTLTYSMNGCSDTMKMIVYPDTLKYSQIIACDIQPAFLIDSLVPGPATWLGVGITDSKKGLFDPSVSGEGTFTINYFIPSFTGGASCQDAVTVTVAHYIAPQISGLSATYCYENTDFNIGLFPANGTLTGTGIVGGNKFNPSVAGAGQHKLIYSYGSGYCAAADSITITVSPPIQTTVTPLTDTICDGKNILITVASSGGSSGPSNNIFTWSHGLLSWNYNTVKPSSSTTYTITTSDGCSDPKVDTVRIFVFPEFYPKFTTSPIACYGAMGSASVTVTGPNTYSCTWNTSPPKTGNSMQGASGSSYLVHIIDAATGCAFDTSIRIPSYGVIKSLFSVNPDLPCIPYDQNLLTFIDQSFGADTGYWVINDDTIPYSLGQNPQFLFEKSGNYTVTLHVYNDGNCDDIYSLNVCIQESSDIFIPDVFSPNGDGLNDLLYVRGGGIKELRFIIYDRLGEKIFETTNPDKSWDGTYKNKAVPPGIFVWYVDAVLFNGKKITQKGDISLVR